MDCKANFLMKIFFKDLIFFLLNEVVSKIPSRKFRIAIFRLCSGNKINRSCIFGLKVRILNVQNISIGSKSNINYEVILDGRGSEITIDSNVDIGPRATIWTLQHDCDNHGTKSAPVEIGKNVWIGSGATILPGVSVGSNSVIAAQAIVTKSIPRNVMVAGNPAKIIKKISRSDVDLLPLRRFR